MQATSYIYIFRTALTVVSWIILLGNALSSNDPMATFLMLIMYVFSNLISFCSYEKSQDDEGNNNAENYQKKGIIWLVWIISISFIIIAISIWLKKYIQEECISSIAKFAFCCDVFAALFPVIFSFKMQAYITSAEEKTASKIANDKGEQMFRDSVDRKVSAPEKRKKEYREYVRERSRHKGSKGGK